MPNSIERREPLLAVATVATAFGATLKRARGADRPASDLEDAYRC